MEAEEVEVACVGPTCRHKGGESMKAPVSLAEIGKVNSSMGVVKVILRVLE